MKLKIISYLIFPVLLILSLNSGCMYDEVVPEIPDPPTTASFSDDLIPKFNASCNFSGCHSPGEEPPDLSPNNAYNALIDGGYINLENPEQSELYIWVNGEGDLDMPLTGTDPELVALVLLWIQEGAQNN